LFLLREQLDLLKQWIAGGARWPDETRQKEIARANEASWSSEDGIAVKTSGGLSEEWTGRKYKPEGLWAYQSVQKPAMPRLATDATERNKHPIDVFIEASWPDGVTPALPADPRTFIRRATFDLIGLPSTPEQVADFEEAFVTNADAAVKTLVNRLLDSPHYGERMTQHWLDVVRYADSSGFANDYERGNAWRYRDYVVSSFNADKPYDQFIREQIAGDEIDPDNPEKIIATGFLRMGP
jgi:hypothetical protein